MPAPVRPLAVSIGDPAGVGLELLALAWHQRATDRLPAFYLIGDVTALTARAKTVRLELPVREISGSEEAASAFADALPVLHRPLPVSPVAGDPDPANGPSVIASIEEAVEAVRHGVAAAVVTLPIAKSVLRRAGFRHPGHTEFLADLAQRHWPGHPAEPVMMIASEPLNVVPLTIHIPLSSVPTAINADLIRRTLRIMVHAMRTDFGIPQPRIVVTGLNPHAGEDGQMGTEDRDIIAPAVQELANKGLLVTGPHPADTLFHESRRATYDAVLAMYHDQALIPVKTLAFDSGVNVTLGLPFVRTSPDHGTAFDIAGKGVASPTSLIEALRMAARHAARRATIGETR